MAVPWSQLQGSLHKPRGRAGGGTLESAPVSILLTPPSGLGGGEITSLSVFTPTLEG